MKKVTLTVAQAIINYLKNQYVERDGKEHRFFAGCAGIFGHGNLAGFGQALEENPDFRYIMVRNEQAAVHTAVGYAKMKNEKEAKSAKKHKNQAQDGRRWRIVIRAVGKVMSFE